MAGQDDAGEIDIVIGDMVKCIRVYLVFIAAVLVLSGRVIANNTSLAHFSLVENFSVHMQKAPIFEGKVRNWILSVGDSGLEVVMTEQVIEPGSKLGISNPWTSEIVELSDFILVRHQMSSGMCGQSRSQTMSSHTKSKSTFTLYSQRKGTLICS